MTQLNCVEIEPQQGTATHSVIWLHGLGADGNDFAPLVPHLQFSASVKVRFIFPHAPHLPVTVNGGMRMPAWYDILSMSIEREVDETQLRASANNVVELIEREVARGVPTENILLAGFSQGGAVAYETALSFPKPLAGLMALSTYLATQDSLQLSTENKSLPILIQHGLQDPIVPEGLGQRAATWLTQAEYPVTYQTFNMQHQVCAEQVAAMNQWLQQLWT